MSSMIYLVTTSNVAVEQNASIPWQNIGRRITPMLENTPNGVIAPCSGYYKVTGTVSFTAPTTGDVEIVVRKAGVPIQGIYAAATVGTADTEIHTLTLTGWTRVLPCDGPVTLDVFNTGVAINVTNANLSVEYVR